MKLIDKDAVMAEIERLKADALQKKEQCKRRGLEKIMHQIGAYNKILSFLDTLEVIDPYAQCIQYQSVKDGIKAHAETYSFNIESELFQQLTKEQQKLWRKEIEYACTSGGEVGVELARDPRYKENLEVKEVDLEKEIDKWWWGKTWQTYGMILNQQNIMDFAKHFFELGLSVSNKAQKGE